MTAVEGKRGPRDGERPIEETADNTVARRYVVRRRAVSTSVEDIRAVRNGEGSNSIAYPYASEPRRTSRESDVGLVNDATSPQETEDRVEKKKSTRNKKSHRDKAEAGESRGDAFIDNATQGPESIQRDQDKTETSAAATEEVESTTMAPPAPTMDIYVETPSEKIATTRDQLDARNHGADNNTGGKIRASHHAVGGKIAPKNI